VGENWFADFGYKVREAKSGRLSSGVNVRKRQPGRFGTKGNATLRGGIDRKGKRTRNKKNKFTQFKWGTPRGFVKGGPIKAGWGGGAG